MDLIKKYLKEQETKDSGWQKAQTDRKDQFGNRIKNVARRLARQGMQAAMKDLKKGPEAGKRQVEEVEELDELKRSTIRSYGNKRIRDLEGDKSVEPPFKPKPKSFSNPKRDVISTGLVRASARLSGVKPTQKEEVSTHPDVKFQKDMAAKEKAKLDALKAYDARKDYEKMREEAELDEAETSKLYNYAFDKYADITSGKNKKDKSKAPGYEKIARNAFKMGISRPMKKPNLPKEAELDESLKKKLAAMGVAATMAASPAAARVTDGGQSFAQQTAQQTTQPQSVKAPKEIPSKSYLQNVASGKSRSMMNPDTAKEMLKKHYNENVDLVSKYTNLGEGKYGSFRVRTTSGTFGGPKLPRRPYVYQGDSDPRTGLPLGFSNPPKSDKPENEKDKVKK